MDNNDNNSMTATSVEESVATALRTAQDTVRRSYEECEECVRESPGSSLACAIAVGYFLRILPIAGLIGGVVRLLAALIKPAILLFGAAKLYQLIQRQDAR